MQALRPQEPEGKRGGRRKALDEEKAQRLYKLYDEKNADGSRKYAIKEICEMMDISRSSLYRYLGKGRRLWSVSLDEGKFTHLSLRPTKSDDNLLRPTPLLHRNCCLLPTIPGKM
jgi:DNA invertase Pin-like site-specific DNA recombinase